MNRKGQQDPNRKVFQTGSSPTDSTRIDLSYSYRVLGGVGNTSQRLRDCRMVAKADMPSEMQITCTVRGRQGVW